MFEDLLEMNILIVDDDTLSQKLLKKLLEKQGYKNVMVADSGENALALIHKELPDLVLLDIYMSGIDGYEVCRRLQSDELTSNISVIIVTGGAAQADEAIERSFKAGATDFITKPVRSIEFQVRIKSSLMIKRSHDLLMEELKKSETAEKEKVKLVEKLELALSELKTLKGILPICSHCKNIRDDKGSWKELEDFIQDHSEAEFSHGICPDCIKKYYSNEEWYDEKKEK